MKFFRGNFHLKRTLFQASSPNNCRSLRPHFRRHCRSPEESRTRSCMPWRKSHPTDPRQQRTWHANSSSSEKESSADYADYAEFFERRLYHKRSTKNLRNLRMNFFFSSMSRNRNQIRLTQ